MRLIKLAIISFVFLFIVITIISLFIPSHIRVSKAIDIKSSSATVISLIENKSNWVKWHPAYMNQKEKIDTIEQPVKKSDTLFLLKLIPSNAKTLISTWEIHNGYTADSLTLQWFLDFQLHWYPWEKFSTLFYDKTYGSVMEQGLTNIKQLVE
jgi:hypothetical protein